MQVSDWMPTILTGLLGLTIHSPPNAPALDGIDSWAAIAAGDASNRTGTCAR
eukprot:COSAG06_NODE_4118_length_4547_cov_22.177633_3_plen_52_part_00